MENNNVNETTLRDQSQPSYAEPALGKKERKNAFQRFGFKEKSIFLNVLSVLSLVILIIVFSIGNDQFLSMGNVYNILRQSSILLIVSLGITFILLMGSIDLSFASIMTFSGVVSALVIVNLGLPPVTGVIFSMAAGAVAGLINGVIFAYGRVPSFLTTLGTSFVVNGIALMLLQGSPIPVTNPGFLQLTRGTLIGQIPNIVIWAVVVYGLTIFVAFKTRFGRYMYAIGGGELVAQMAGVSINRFKMYAFIVSGLLAGLAGTLMASRIGSASPNMGGDSLVLDSIAAVVIGGTSLTGGVGGPHKTLLGVLLITILGTGMDMISVDPFMQIVIKGVVVVLAVAIGLERTKIKMVK